MGSQPEDHNGNRVEPDVSSPERAGDRQPVADAPTEPNHRPLSPEPRSPGLATLRTSSGTSRSDPKGPPAITLSERVGGLPQRPGCYLFRGAPRGEDSGDVLYVGKAKNLRSRVRSYFQEHGSDVRYFIPLLRGVVHDIETIVTNTEKEAAILENSLIKRYQPRYNAKLRDDKEFLTLRIDTNADWPKLGVVRRPKDDGAKYFGPYHSATAARRSLRLVNKHFQLRTCTDQELASRQRPCLQYQIKRCPAPCVMPVDRPWYGEQVRAVELFLSGRHDELTDQLALRMRETSSRQEYELAAIYRDQLRAVEFTRMEQRVVQTGAAISVTQDVIGLHREADLAEVVVLYVRSGRVMDTASFSYRGAEIDTPELVAGFLSDHYAELEDGGAAPPDEILLPEIPEAVSGIAELLTERRARATHGERTARVRVLVPRRGPRAQLVQMATDNAKHAFEQKRRAQDDVQGRLEELQRRLRLPAVPRIIECCDISHLGGGDTVGSIVSLVDGAPAPKRYKWFRVKMVANDDYGAMYEVLARRFRRGAAAAARPTAATQTVRPAMADEPHEVTPAPGADDAWELPDLFLVDGGRGQLAVALAAARDLGLHELPIAALAKERRGPRPFATDVERLAENVSHAGTEYSASEEDGVVDRVYLPDQKNPIELREHSASLLFLARARDEAHRFANAAREKVGTKRRMHSAVDDWKGIGVALKKELLRRFGSVRAIEAAGDDALLAVPGFTKRHLTALRKHVPTPKNAVS